MGLTRKKVRVKAKSGKTYTRNMMVKSSNSAKRGLAAMNPWSPSHTEHVDTSRSRLGERAKLYGSAGPGSSYSLLAHMAGAQRQVEKARWEIAQNIAERDPRAASIRRLAGRDAVGRAQILSSNYSHRPEIANRMMFTSEYHYTTDNARRMLYEQHGRENVHIVHQDPRKWVR